MPKYCIYQAMTTDEDGKPCRMIYEWDSGKKCGYVYKVRARFGGHHHPVRSGFKAEFDGSPVRDPVIAMTLTELRERLANME